MGKKSELKDFDIVKVSIPIKGISPLIVHKFSEKMRKAIEDKQQGVAKNKKHDIRNPEEEVELAKHYDATNTWEGFPASGFKASIIRGGKLIGEVMKDAQTSIFIVADCPETQLVRIYGESRKRTDMVKIGMGVADVRYRPEYVEWSANLVIEYNAGVISQDRLLQMIRAGGYGCGIGEGRPERTKMQYGRYDLAV